jgi:hypothetical protein
LFILFISLWWADNEYNENKIDILYFIN